MSVHDEFKHHMDSMLKHYQFEATHTYPLPVKLASVAYPDDALPPEIISEIADATKFAEQRILSFLAGQQADLTTTIDNEKARAAQQKDGLQAALTTSSFVAQMKAMEAEAQEKSKKSLAAAYDQLIAVGQKHPPAQPHILNQTQLISTYNANVLGSLTALYSGLGPAGYLAGGVIAAGKWFEGAGKSVGNFFSSIF
jgi:hypothetical protein